MRLTNRQIALVSLLMFSLLVLLILIFDKEEESTEASKIRSTEKSSAVPFLKDDKKNLVVVTTTTTTSTTTTTTTVPPTTTTIQPPPVRTGGVNWYAVAMCESSLGTGAPQWHINTGNGYYGGLQFAHSTWIANGGGKYAENAHLTSPENQIAIASGMSLSHWPVCGKYG